MRCSLSGLRDLVSKAADIFLKRKANVDSYELDLPQLYLQRRNTAELGGEEGSHCLHNFPIEFRVTNNGTMLLIDSTRLCGFTLSVSKLDCILCSHLRK